MPVKISLEQLESRASKAKELKEKLVALYEYSFNEECPPNFEAKIKSAKIIAEVLDFDLTADLREAKE